MSNYAKMTKNVALAEILSEITGKELDSIKRLNMKSRIRLMERAVGHTEEQMFEELFDEYEYSNEQITELCTASLLQLWVECKSEPKPIKEAVVTRKDDEDEFNFTRNEWSGQTASKLHKSYINTPVKRVHEIADAMPGARRKDVIAECTRQGIAYNTARTQYQRWYSSQAGIDFQQRQEQK